MTLSSGTDNVIAALEQRNRVCDVLLWCPARWQLEKVLAAMQVPFPELTDLQLVSDDETPPVIPDSFLDGSAPRLRSLTLSGVPFPRLPKLLMSATHLVELGLFDIPYSGYISPEAMVAVLSVLSSLESLILEFQSPQSRPDRESRILPSPKRAIALALFLIHFKGVTEYLEELVTHIDTPQLREMNIAFFNQFDFDCRRLAQFVNRTPTLRALDEAHVLFSDTTAGVELCYHDWSKLGNVNLQISISCREPDWQISSVEQVCNFSLHPISTVEDLYIDRQYHLQSVPVWENVAIEDTLWLQLLRSFTAVKNLYLSKEFAPGIAAALQQLVGGRTTEVLPSLQNIFVEGLQSSGPFRENIGQFVAARQLSNPSVAISVCDNYYYWDMERM